MSECIALPPSPPHSTFCASCRCRTSRAHSAAWVSSSLSELRLGVTRCRGSDRLVAELRLPGRLLGPLPKRSTAGPRGSSGRRLHLARNIPKKGGHCNACSFVGLGNFVRYQMVRLTARLYCVMASPSIATLCLYSLTARSRFWGTPVPS